MRDFYKIIVFIFLFFRCQKSDWTRIDKAPSSVFSSNLYQNVDFLFTWPMNWSQLKIEISSNVYQDFGTELVPSRLSWLLITILGRLFQLLIIWCGNRNEWANRIKRKKNNHDLITFKKYFESCLVLWNKLSFFPCTIISVTN